MGQRSQIYIRYNDGDKKMLIANYYQWNYGERMISRARYTMEWIAEMIDIRWKKSVLERIPDVNFDMKDMQLHRDILKDYEDFNKDDAGYGTPEHMNRCVFYEQHNNDGQLFIDVLDNEIKYAFSPTCLYDLTVLDAEGYMNWNDKSWRTPDEYMGADVIKTCKKNISEIEKTATLMTSDELKSYLGYDYTHLLHQESPPLF